jgi:hypothetical protein
MDRRVITAAIVEQADRLLVFGIDHATIAARLGITEYVVDVMAGDRLRNGRKQPPQQQRSTRRRGPTHQGTDAVTIRRIQRMLAVGILNHSQIAREVGVSNHLVAKVARGRRAPVSTERPAVFRDLAEHFVRRPIRCKVCGALISIVPCRACRACDVSQKNSSGP